MTDQPQTKTCNRCHETKPLTEFHKLSKAPDGRQYTCKPCAIERALRRAKDNPEAKRAADQRYASTDEYKAKRNARRADNVEHAQEVAKRWRENNREHYLEKKREEWKRYREKHPLPEKPLPKRPHTESQKEKKRQLYYENRERIQAQQKAYRDAHPEVQEANRERSRNWQINNVDRRRDAHLRQHYGITLEQYNAMLAEQGSVCAICHKDGTTGRGGRLHVDHDHETGAVRGLICNHCNNGLGHFLDNPDTMRSGAEYIEKFRARTIQ